MTSAPTMCAPRSCPVSASKIVLAELSLVFSECDGFAVAGEREAANSELTAARLCFRLGEADAGDLGAAVCAARDELLADRVGRVAGDRLDADDAIMLRFMSEHWRSRHVPDGVDAPDVCPAVFIDSDAAAIEIDAHGLKSEIFDVSLHAGGDDHGVYTHFGAAGAFDPCDDLAIRGAPRADNLRCGSDCYPVLLELGVSEFRDVFVLGRQDLRQRLNDRDLGAEPAVKGSEFNADSAGTDDEQAFGKCAAEPWPRNRSIPVHRRAPGQAERAAEPRWRR